MESGELRPDFGPDLPHRRAGATLVTARPPLAAFNVELDSGDVEVARAVAAGLRESGGGLPGVRAIGLVLSSGRAQVSTNVHDPLAVPLGAVVERVRELAAPLGARPLEAELVGLFPAAALAGYPEDVPMRGFDPERHVIERRLAARDRLDSRPWPRPRRSAAASSAAPRAAASTPAAAPNPAPAPRPKRRPAPSASRRPGSTCRRPGAARSSAASPPPSSSSSCCWSSSNARSAPRSRSAASCSPSTSPPGTSST